MRTNSHLCFSELKETESAHREALGELEKMRDTMDTMEQERADMVAEVEAQIEKALASMAVDIEDSDEYDDSRPGSRMSFFLNWSSFAPPIAVHHVRDAQVMLARGSNCVRSALRALWWRRTK